MDDAGTNEETVTAASPEVEDPALREEFVAAASRFAPYVALEFGDSLFFVSTESKYGRRLFVTQGGRRLDRSLRAVRSVGLEPPGTTFVDVCANVGASTMQALQRHGFARAVEFSAHRLGTHGGLDHFAEVLSPAYTHFYDLKPSFPSSRGFEPLSALEELLGRRKDKTDLLVVRLPDAS